MQGRTKFITPKHVMTLSDEYFSYVSSFAACLSSRYAKSAYEIGHLSRLRYPLLDHAIVSFFFLLFLEIGGISLTSCGSSLDFVAEGQPKADCLTPSNDKIWAIGIGESEGACGESGSDSKAISGCECFGCDMMSKPGVIWTDSGSPAMISASS